VEKSKIKLATSIRRIIARYERLKSNQKIKVYHTTSLEYAVKMVNGFDALEIRHRHFNGPKHRGLFISPMPLTQFGNVVFEIEVYAKFLHGTDYSGNIGREGQDPHKGKVRGKDLYLEEKYPQSFRPSLSESLNYTAEPQAIYLGLVKPSQIKRVQYNGEWMSREGFIAIRETNEYAKKLRLVDTQFDLSNPSRPIEEIYAYIDKLRGKGREGITRKLFSKTLERSGRERGQSLIEKTLGQLGFGSTATRRYTQLIMEDIIMTNKEKQRRTATSDLGVWKSLSRKPPSSGDVMRNSQNLQG
jgi:hypothetical protein